MDWMQIVTLLISVYLLWRWYNRKRLLQGHEVSAAEAQSAWEKGEFFLDVRTIEEYQAGHIPQSRLLPLSELHNRAAEVPKDRDVYLVCRSGNRSAQAATWLLNNGYDRVYNASGGMISWKGPVEK